MSPSLPLATLLFSAALLASPQDPASEDSSELAAIEASLELRPGDASLYLDAVNAAASEGDKDKALWYGLLGLEASAAPGTDKDVAERLKEFVAALAPEGATPDELQADHAEALFDLSQLCSRRKLYANFADLLLRCRGTAFEERAREQLDKLFSKDKAIDALLASGIDVPERPRRRPTSKEIARADRTHTDWSNPYEIKGKYYTLTSDVGAEMSHALLDALEQMNAFYRQVFDYKTRGQTMRRCAVAVYKNRAEFDWHEDMADSQTTLGFFQPGQNRVATYLPEDVDWGWESLWSTLFHEASHQFTGAIWPGLIPAWLNEGTASYFEGAKLRPGGRVDFNLVPDNRLGGVLGSLQRKSLGLREVISYNSPGSYDGEYYPFGWGIVYFCHNYEDENSERVYLPIYREHMASWKKSGSQNSLERFTTDFVEKAERPGIETFADFEALWVEWIQELGAIHFGPPKMAEKLIERGLRQFGHEKYEAAVESFRWALRKRPDDARALAELAKAYTELEMEDAAIHTWRRLFDLALSMGDLEAAMPHWADCTAEAARSLAIEGIDEIDERVAEAVPLASEGLEKSAIETARRYAEEGFPRAALLLLARGQALLGTGGARLAGEAVALREATGVETFLWRRFLQPTDAPDWNLPEGEWSIADGKLAGDGSGLGIATLRSPELARFQMQVRVTVEEEREQLVLGVSLQAGAGGKSLLMMHLPGHGMGGAAILEPNSNPALRRPQSAPRLKEKQDFLFEVNVDGGVATFAIDGVDIELGEFAAIEGPQRIGLVLQGGKATFSDLRMAY